MNTQPILILAALLASTGTGLAQDFTQCDAALVKDTYSSFSQDTVDWRLANYVNNQEYDRAKQDGGVNAVIYGIPVGATYGEFHERANRAIQSLGEALDANQIRNVEWTGLSSTSSNAYSTCLTQVALASDGLHLVPRFATTSNISLTLKWAPTGTEPTSIPIAWVGDLTDKASLPKRITAGTQVVIIDRPKVELAIGVNSDVAGASDSVVIEPLPKPLPEPLYNITGLYSGIYISQSGRTVTYSYQDTCCTYSMAGVYTSPTTIIGVQTRVNKATLCSVPMPMKWTVRGDQNFCDDETVEPNSSGNTCDVAPNYNVKNKCSK